MEYRICQRRRVRPYNCEGAWSYYWRTVLTLDAVSEAAALAAAQSALPGTTLAVGDRSPLYGKFSGNPAQYVDEPAEPEVFPAVTSSSTPISQGGRAHG